MKRLTAQQVGAVCSEYARACLTELHNIKDLDAPSMSLCVAVDGKGVDFIDGVNQGRLSEHTWTAFFKDMMATAPSESNQETDRYRPSDAEVTWAGKVAIAVKNKRLDKMRRLLDKGPAGEGMFSVSFPMSLAQSLPLEEEEEEEQRPRSLRGELVVNDDSRSIDILIEPFARKTEAERNGYVRLIHATVCWFILRNLNVVSEADTATVEAINVESISVEGISVENISSSMQAMSVAEGYARTSLADALEEEMRYKSAAKYAEKYGWYAPSYMH